MDAVHQVGKAKVRQQSHEKEENPPWWRPWGSGLQTVL